MFVHDFVHVVRPARDVTDAVLANQGAWLTSLGSVRGDELVIRVGPPGPRSRSTIGKEVRVELGAPVASDDRVIVPMHWEATGMPRLFPTLDALLEITPLGADRTRIGVSGHYTVPFGALGRRADDWLLHGLAEETIRGFLGRLVQALEIEKAPQAV
jgi:hypothetical protein